MFNPLNPARETSRPAAEGQRMTKPRNDIRDQRRLSLLPGPITCLDVSDKPGGEERGDENDEYA